MYPEASYSFLTALRTALPRKNGRAAEKKAGRACGDDETFGAQPRNPLYNELQVRKSVPCFGEGAPAVSAGRSEGETARASCPICWTAFSF